MIRDETEQTESENHGEAPPASLDQPAPGAENHQRR